MGVSCDRRGILLPAISYPRGKLFPCQCERDDGLQVAKARLPSQRGTDEVSGGYDLCRVTRPPRRVRRIADAGTVRRQIVGAEHLNFRAQTERGLDRELGPHGA
jgi:hypothetical protein